MADLSESADVVISGLGVVASTGITVEDHWAAVLDGKTGIGHITRFGVDDSSVVLSGEVSGFDAWKTLPTRLVRGTEQSAHLALAAAKAALDDCATDHAALPDSQLAVVTAGSLGGDEAWRYDGYRSYEDGPSWLGPYKSTAWVRSAATGKNSTGPDVRVLPRLSCVERTDGLDVIAQARRLLRGPSRLIVAGGVDREMCQHVLLARTSGSCHLSTSDDPYLAYAPFDVNARGHVLGEGGAILVAERAENARGRSYGSVLGHAAVFDQPGQAGRESVLAGLIKRSLSDARLHSSDIDVVFADAAGDPKLDRIEADAITAVFGPNSVPVTAPKTLTGRLHDGAALDVATALLALRDGVIPHTAGTERLAPGIDLDIVLKEPRQRPLSTALVLGRGFRGLITALVLGSGDRY
ncbi:act minimal PKS chain-length factor (CLF/KS beta) [Lentzea atacamensis]|uniref:Act minimal PKS chain-length factor (CLF/KS beta) n=1 Tax=Lentzea atacamensis TaxID=531938 RepID=A0A316HW88_9PSEU|nr:beta-ketoacyl synthase N-terminal-like domain-containing protein [Lentzea atacamensis]PWK84393.1 act minimal PKS chain-length factor (CLF/KS beta) [Lentzea atacamensis]